MSVVEDTLAVGFFVKAPVNEQCTALFPAVKADCLLQRVWLYRLRKDSGLSESIPQGLRPSSGAFLRSY